MLDKKYGLKYSMPHSVVHIVDNSMYTGDLPVVVADDPSLYASIVVTGAPMGVDNEIITINRSDILNVSFGTSGLTASDIKKYGQGITYPTSLLGQNVPIKFMRVTPQNSTYAFSCLLIQWKWDSLNNIMRVRFKTSEDEYINGLPSGIIHSNFKNPSRFNDSLVKNFREDEKADGWKQRVFMTVIAAGRGKEYNNFNYAINQTQQSKRPANVRYLFSTIDTRTDLVVEQFYGSLINQNNGNRTDAIDTVNVQVNKRVKGSSVLIPTINESAITELYNEYMSHFKEMIPADAANTTDDNVKFVKNVYASMNINIFDPIYGRYIYNGDTDVKLPYYQVDMFDLDIPKLDTSNRISVVLDEKQTIDGYVDNPVALYDILEEQLYGVTTIGDTYHIGDMFVSSSLSSIPIITMITTINQYSGSVTSIPFASVNIGNDKSTTLKAIIENKTDTITIDSIKDSIKELILKKKLVPVKVSGKDKYDKDAVIVLSSNRKSFAIAIIAYNADGSDIDTAKENGSKIVSSADEIRSIIAYPTGKQITSFTTSYNKEVGDIPGTTFVDASGTVDGKSKGAVYVVGYSGKDLITVENDDASALNVGTCPTAIVVTKDIVNTSYDVIIYSNTVTGSWKLEKATVSDGGTGEHEVNSDTYKVKGLENTEVTITKVDSAGKVTGVNVSSSNEAKRIEPGEYEVTKTETPETVEFKILVKASNVTVTITNSEGYTADPLSINRFVIPGTQGSIYRVSVDPTVIPENYYSSTYGVNPTSEMGGISVDHGYAGFFDDDISEIEFKWRYSELLVKAFRGEIDPRIKSPIRVPAKYLFDAGYNTIIGQTILPYIKYEVSDIINASTVFTADEKDDILYDRSIIDSIGEFADIDVKQAMYDLMEYRCYQGIPEDKRPIGPGSGLSLHLDSGITDATTALAINQSFVKRFTNPNASWDIGGYVTPDGISYTYTKRIVDNLFTHMKQYSVNKPFTGRYTNIGPDEYVSFFPDVDATDWELRELLYNSGGNAWVADVNGNLQRKSQRTLYREGDTSDLIQENNMRTLSQLVYLLQNKIDSYLLEYDDDGVLKTLKDECDNMFTNWIGNLVQALDISFERDINPEDGGEIVVCYCNVTFRGLILRVPIIVNVQRRTTNTNEA